MRYKLAHLLALPLVLAVPLSPATATDPSFAIEHLQNIEETEARLVLAALVREQEKLRTEEGTYFHLYSGAPASYEQNTVGPREAFLALDLGNIWRVRRLSPQGETFPKYEIIVAHGSEDMDWKLTVMMGWADPAGRVDSVTMFLGPPPPF